MTRDVTWKLFLPIANIQIAIFVINWWQNGKKSVNDLSPINKSVSKVGLSYPSGLLSVNTSGD